MEINQMNKKSVNRAFLYGDAVKTSFFIRNSKLLFAEESYFFLMASMRKMRMNIPLSYTLEFFQELFEQEITNNSWNSGIVNFMAYREESEFALEKSPVSYYYEFSSTTDVLEIQKSVEVDLMKEINVGVNLLSNIRVSHPESIYAEVYAKENDIDDLILLNPFKRIARSIYGNILLLKDNTILIPKQSEGAYISPLMENFVTFLHKKAIIKVEQEELVAFQSQKADEILIVSDEKGLFTVRKMRNRTFGNDRFSSFIKLWRESLG